MLQEDVKKFVLTEKSKGEAAGAVPLSPIACPQLLGKPFELGQTAAVLELISHGAWPV